MKFFLCFWKHPFLRISFLLCTRFYVQSLAGLQVLTTSGALSQGNDGRPFLLMLLGKSHNVSCMQAEGGGAASNADAAEGRVRPRCGPRARVHAQPGLCAFGNKTGQPAARPSPVQGV